MTSADQILAAVGADQQLAALHAQPWDDPVPLGVRRRTLPMFPTGALPGWVGAMVAAVAEETQTPPDLAACVALAALSTAAGGRALVNVRGSWVEPVNIFTVVAMPPGSRKSPVFRAMTQPLLAAEKDLIERIKPRIVEAELALRVARAAAEKTAAVASNSGKPGGDPDKLAEATDAAMVAESITVPVQPKLVVDDVTPETATSLLAAQGGRLAVLSAEGEIFNIMAGRYSNTPNLGVFLKGHAGDMLRVDRQGRPAEHIDRPALTLGIAVQPEVLADLARTPGFRGKGLLARILYAIPPSNVGYREIEPDPVPDRIAETYAANLARLVSVMHDWDDPARLLLAPDARPVFLAHRQRTEERLRPHTGDLAHIADWGSKYDGAVARIAGLLHLAQHIEDGYRHPISADTINAAIAIGEYYAQHALAVFDAMGADPDLEAARTVHAWLEKHRPEQFTVRQLFNGIRSATYRKVADLRPGLELLEEHGWIRHQPAPERKGPGRPPSPTYHVHPCLHAGAQPPSTPPATQ